MLRWIIAVLLIAFSALAIIANGHLALQRLRAKNSGSFAMIMGGVLGAIGILRWAITGTQRGTPETRSYHPDDPFAEWHPLDDRRYMLDHFYSKLLKLSDTMSTQTGRKLAERRTRFIRTYLDEFKDELAM